MSMPTWWTKQRFGLLINTSVASVPGWAPLGASPDWYRSHLDDDADDAFHAGPLVEVLAHHRDRWGHIDEYDDFAPLLTFNNFDAEEWARLVRESGAGYAIQVARHHDGWTWWDAPGSPRRLTEHGPKRDIIREFAAACERHRITFGVSYSMLDWGGDGDGSMVADQVIDLVSNYGAAALWGDGHWNVDAGKIQTARVLAAVQSIDPEIVINDRWWASPTDTTSGQSEIVTTWEHTIPADITPGSWEARIGMGASLGANRAEPTEHLRSAANIIDLLTEVVAKGGNLLLSVGVEADGSIPESVAATLHTVGNWMRERTNVLAASSPWEQWGDEEVRYLTAFDKVVGIDVSGRARFAALASPHHRVTSVTSVDGDPVPWEVTDTALQIDNVAEGSDRSWPEVYLIGVEPVAAPGALFEPGASTPQPLADLLDGARPGDIIQLGDGQYVGPASIPPGVIVRGLGPDRTQLINGPRHGIMPPQPIVSVGRNARVEHLSIEGDAPLPDGFARPLVLLAEQFGSVLGCRIGGTVDVTAPDVLIRAVTGAGVLGRNADRLHVSRCHLTGNRRDVGIELQGGSEQHLESNRLDGHLCAIRVASTSSVTIRGNTIEARWWGIHVDASEQVRVQGNRVMKTMRAVDVDAGSHTTVDANSVSDGDSGCVIRSGAANAEVYGNHWQHCRIGLLAWDATTLRHQDNVCIDLLEPDNAVVVGPDGA